MGIAYSDDLRRKLLEAHARKEGSLAELAARFSVSLGWALKIRRSLLGAGRWSVPRGRRRGAAKKITPEI